MPRAGAMTMAVLMLAQARAALANGVVHHDRAGNLLNDEVDILRALVFDRELQFDGPTRPGTTTTEAEYAKILANLEAGRPA